MSNCHDLSLKCDVLLLADVLRIFRNRRLGSCCLCSRRINAPFLRLDAMLNMIKFELDFVPDVDVYLLFEKGMRHDVSNICNRCSKANTKYLTTYNPENLQDILRTWTKIIYTTMICQNLFQRGDLTLFRMNLFGAAHRWDGGGLVVGQKALPTTKNQSHISYSNTMIMPYLRKVEKYVNHVINSLSSAEINIFLPEICKFCYIRKYKCRE